MGTLLGERGVGFSHPYARANLSHPEMVAGIHEEYLRAGASVIETNTFSANRYKLEIHDLEDRVRQVNVEGARLARRAADTVAADTLVLGAIGPLVLQPHFCGVRFSCRRGAGGKRWQLVRNNKRSKGSPDGRKSWRHCTRASPLVSPVRRCGHEPDAFSAACSNR